MASVMALNEGWRSADKEVDAIEFVGPLPSALSVLCKADSAWQSMTLSRGYATV